MSLNLAHALPKLKRILREEESFAHILHPKPDADGVGSAMGLHLYLKRLGKKSKIYAPDPIPKNFQSLPFASEVELKIPSSPLAPVIFAYDAGDRQRLYKAYGKHLESCRELINIDHHITNDHFGTLNFVDTSASATGEIVYLILKKLKAPVDKAMANWLYLAIMTDTGSFRYSNTTAQTLRIAAELVEKGAEPHTLYRKAYEETDIKRLAFFCDVIPRMKRELKGKLVYADIPKELFQKYKQSAGDSHDILDAMRSLKGVDVVVLFKEEKDRVRVSLRSEHTDVAKVASAFGGGGHRKAAGLELSLPMKQAKNRVLNFLRKELA